MKGAVLIQAIKDAVAIGYRAIDTAAVYRNEDDIGIALAHIFKHTAVKRSELFIQSKIGPSNQGFNETTACVYAMLKSLGIEYLDCVLIHWPGKAGVNPASPDNASARSESYKALLKLKEQGVVRQIGVSNYTLAHLEELVSMRAEDRPVLNQVEVHPLWNGWVKDMHADTVQQSGLMIQAYTLFGEGNFLNGGIVLESVVKIAQRVRMERGESTESVREDQYKGCGCVLIMWAVMKGMLVAVKASSYARLEENYAYDQLMLSVADMSAIDDEVMVHGPKKFCWNPVAVV